MKPLLSIQYLRALAALSVAVFHALQWARIPFDIGSAGVDVFFVISGFIMEWTAGRPGLKPLEFLKRRLVRIAPLYWLITLGLALAALGFPTGFPDVKPEGWHVLASLAFIQHRNPDGQPFPLLAPGWTLNYEAVFYLLFALGLALPKGQRLFFMVAALVGATACGFLYPPAYEMLLNPLLLEFLGGMLLARALADGPVISRGAGWTLVAAGLSAFAAFHLLGVKWDLWRPLFWGLPALMLVAGLVSVELAPGGGGLPRIGLLKALGDASYSLYLLHPLVIGAVAVWFGVWRPWLFFPLALGGSAIVAWLSWKCVETPIAGWFKRPLRDAAEPAHTRP